MNLRSTSLVAVFLVLLIFLPHANAVDEWYNSTWHYRQRLEFNASTIPRIDHPIEIRLNFTDLLRQAGSQNLSFDNQSLRVFEYNATSGSILSEVPFQLDSESGYNYIDNAVGELVFIASGYTPQYSTRLYYAYFDTIGNRIKPPVSYTSPLSLSNTASDFSVNNSLLQWYVDTARGENSSGLYHVEGFNPMFLAAAGEKTFEYSEYTNGTSNFSFNFSGNMEFIVGPVRITAILRGAETLWGDPDAATGEAYLVKKYKFYNSSNWIVIEQNLTNIAAAGITRSSTEAGAIAFEAARAFGADYIGQQNTSEPFSWSHSADSSNSLGVGFVNLGQNGTANFLAINISDRAGINLSTTTIAAGNSIQESAILKFNDTTGDILALKNLSLGLLDPFALNASLEAWKANFSINTNVTIFNRNETVILTVNVTQDFYNFTGSVNATIDNGTANPADDYNITLFDDGLHGDGAAGDKLFSANFTLSTGAALGQWNITAKLYGPDELLLSMNSTAFNVTDDYNLTIVIFNPFGLVDRFVNATLFLRNYRVDLPVSGAALACNYFINASTDYGNGTYSISIQSPSLPINYTLFCNATYAGNFVNISANFTSEAAKTNITVYNFPNNLTVTNITLLQNYNFSINMNATNTGNGSANLANFTLTLPGNWSATSLTFACNNVSVGQTCSANFTITVSNRTVPGIYYANATFHWQNPDLTLASNTSQTIVNVTSNPLLDVLETMLYNVAGQGLTKRIGNFTLNSLGNDAVRNITFSVQDLPGLTFVFIPANYSSLSAGGQQSIQINVTVPTSHASGDYMGIINITSSDGGNDSIMLNLSISGANVSISTNPLNFTADNITQTQNQTFEIQVNLTNFGNCTAARTNITIQAPAGISSNSSLYQCGNLTVGGNCTSAFIITVLNTTAPGTYLVNVSAVWNNEDIGNSANTSVINITVTQNPILELAQAFLSVNATHGNTTITGNFTILSRGNYQLQDVNVSLTGLPNFTITFGPQNLSSIAAGSQQVVQINVTVPAFYEPTIENGTLNISTTNAGYSELILQLGISVDRDWSLDPATCEKTESPEAGTVCTITVNNTGNTFMNFTVTPATANYSTANATSFSIEKQSSFSFNITYNISGQPKIMYNATFVVNATASNSFPENRTIRVALVPFQSIPSSLTISPLIIQNLQSVQFDMNVTDSNLVGINNATALVSMPNGTTTQVILYLFETTYNSSGNITQWRGNYPNTTGSTALHGDYSVTSIAFDNVDVNGTSTGTFYAYPILASSVSTLSGTYARGSTASIYFRAQDFGGLPLQNANATVWIRDANGVLVFNNSYVTSVSGIAEPLPTHYITPDGALGNWTIYSASAYYDGNASQLMSDTSNSTFLVVDSSGGSSNVTFSGLLTDFTSGDLFFGGDTIELAINVYDVNGAPLDPDYMNITIYSPNESIYSFVNFSDINHSSTGLYFYKFTAPANASSGVYRAELNAVRGSYFTRNLALFRISSSLYADVETSFVWYPSSVMTFRMIVYAGDGQPLDPSSLNLTVIDPAGNTYFAVGLSSLTRQSTGYYLYNYAMGVNTSTGNYYAQISASRDAGTIFKLKPFRVSQGGPYDIRLELLESRVYAGDYLDFRAVMENKGEVTQDVTLEYWVTDGSQTWFYGSEAVLTPAFQNTSVLRSAYIFTSQPPGTYTIHGRVTYDLIKPPIDVAYTFEVAQRPAATATPATGGQQGVATLPPSGAVVTLPPSASAPPFRDYSGMQIISYPEEISMQAGEIKYPKIQVKNTGLVLLHNLTVTLAGIPLAWLEILPSRINALAPGDVATFVIRITAPTTEKTSVKKVRVIAVSSERKDEARFDVAIFESKLAMIEYQIQRLKERSQTLANDAKEAEKLGKDLTEAWRAIEEANKYISAAEDNLRNEEMDDAQSNAQIADTLLSKGRGALISAPFLPPAYAQLPSWITIAMGFVGTGMGVLVFWFVRKRRKQEPAEKKESPGVIEKVAEVMQKTDKDSLEKEKSKIMRTLRLLEEELEDGSISQSAYSELKRRYDRKIAEIEKKLSK
ncbi:MAG: NEW3 domain-containing protein [Candidatus Micrarchaeota archaeon]